MTDAKTKKPKEINPTILWFEDGSHTTCYTNVELAKAKKDGGKDTPAAFKDAE